MPPPFQHHLQFFTPLYLYWVALRGSDLQAAILWVGAKLKALFVICDHDSLHVFHWVRAELWVSQELFHKQEAIFNGNIVRVVVFLRSHSNNRFFFLPCCAFRVWVLWKAGNTYSVLVLYINHERGHKTNSNNVNLLQASKSRDRGWANFRT